LYVFAANNFGNVSSDNQAKLLFVRQAQPLALYKVYERLKKMCGEALGNTGGWRLLGKLEDLVRDVSVIIQHSGLSDPRLSAKPTSKEIEAVAPAQSPPNP